MALENLRFLLLFSRMRRSCLIGKFRYRRKRRLLVMNIRHAGYSYSGRAAAYAFGNRDPSRTSRVFLLCPSDHYYTPKYALSAATVYRTPLGDLPVDMEVIEELKATGKFELMDMHVDEAEHSMEMHLPYIAEVFEGYQASKEGEDEGSTSSLIQN